MRVVLCNALVEHSANPDFIFLTGDLGFNALEPLRDAAGSRFINAGVAEQNMVSVAAGLAAEGFKPWVYSIAPFLFGRAFEQIRNDVCLHGLPVKLAGNGGGYGYGVMGATHHALEDYGVLLGLPNIRVFIPAFALDVPPIIKSLMSLPSPAYLRLGKCEKPQDFTAPPYAPWRRLLRGGGPTMLAVGPLVASLLETLRLLEEARRPDLWVLTELPLAQRCVPQDFLFDLRRSRHLFVVEEHVAQGGVAQQLCHLLCTMGKMPPQLTHRCALGYVSGLYGSQKFHREECGLDPRSIAEQLERTS